MSRRPSRIALFLISAGLAASNAVPASADLIDLRDPILPVPTVTPLQLPDVRDLPIVRDVPIVQKLPDVRELPVVRNVTEPAPATSDAPSGTATPAPSSEPATAGGSGGGSSVDGGSTARAGSSSGGGSSSGNGSTSGDGSPSGNGSTSGNGSSGGSATRGGSTSGVVSGQAPGGASANGTRRRARGAGFRSRRGGKPPTPTERRVRRTVRQLSGCLGALGTGSRRVLVLRAGIGALPALSRHAVAKRLDVPIRQVARTERRGLRALRRSARAGHCGGQPATAPAATTVATSSGGGGSAPAGTAADGAEPRGTEGRQLATGSSGVKDEFRSGSAEPPATLVSRVAGNGPPILLAVLLSFLAGFGGVWALQHRGGRGRGVA